MRLSDRKQLGVLIFNVLLCAPFQNPGANDLPPASNFSIEIKKSQRLLLVKNGDVVEKRFHIAWGRGGPGDKRRHGDNRTPTGVYRIVDFHDDSPFHFFMHINYPNVKDAFWGLQNNIISQQEFSRILTALRHGIAPPQNTALGGAIGIHGLGLTNNEKLRMHKNLNWTEGCIALTNSEIEDLRHYVHVGTRVEIVE